MKFFDLEFDNCLALITKKKGGGNRDVIFVVYTDSYGCPITAYTVSGTAKDCAQGEWHVVYHKGDCSQQ